MNDSERLQQLVLRVQNELNRIPEDEFSAKVHVTKWSKKEIVGHLCDSAMNNYMRFVKIALSEHPIQLEGYHQVRWVEINDYQNSYDANRIIQLWFHLNMQISNILAQIPENHYTKEGILASGEKVTLAWLANDYIEHMIHHFRQIFGNERIEMI
ncbi:DinB family protein [Paenibacillus wenxiniae]|uniref:DinB family protein n=1 Tax=Paenibacillus wenxiniae TaxID=1636843 RepID=A0ABW4RCW6_9BACL